MSKKLMMAQMKMASSIPLTDWIQSARSSLVREDYLDCALTIALKLTNSLCINFELLSPSSDHEKKSGDDSSGSGIKSALLVLQVEDVVAENVQVIIAKVNEASHHYLSRASFTANEVVIQPQQHVGSKPQDVMEKSQFQHLLRDVCFSLGKILFMLFSQGELIDMTADKSVEDLRGGLVMGEIAINVDGPASKRSSSSPVTNPNPMCTNVKATLQERGVPLSICQLISDLLEAEKGNQFISDKTLLSLEETKSDLMSMITHPGRFLNDHTCPKRALERTALFSRMDDDLYGREKELRVLMHTAARVAMRSQRSTGIISSSGGDDYLCEAIFLSGHSGSGKSSLIKQTVSSCVTNGWLVLLCKFDPQVAPLSALLQSFDNFFGNFVPVQGDNGRAPSVQESIDRITLAITSSIDVESFNQLCDLLPNVSKLFPMAVDYVKKRNTRNGSIDHNNECSMGSGTHRLFFLFHLIFKAVCSGGHPVVICAEDLHWADAFTMDVFGHFAQSVGHSSVFSVSEESPHQGFLLLGSFRDNQVEKDGFLLTQIKSMEQSQQNINVSRIHLDELSVVSINNMLSFKFCLPMRHTAGLAQLVYHKTRGNPLYIIEFLRSIIQKMLICFSVKYRRWTWDDTLIDQQMMSKGVVELLTSKLRQLPSEVIETLKVMSCLGSRVKESTFNLLDLGQFALDMMEALGQALQAGIIEKDGPVFAFSHDMLREATYNLIPSDKKKMLHKRIGKDLVQDPLIGQNAELCTLVVDQINMCEDGDGILNPAERSSFARLNLAAGKHSMGGASYEQARGYFEAGISLLHSNNWKKQYSLSLELYEMSVVASFNGGTVETVWSRLEAILSNAKSFDDTLNARALLAKFLASQELYVDATNGVLDVLSSLGEIFPTEINQSQVTGEIEAAREMLKEITKETMLSLPTMTNAKKVTAMKFMTLLLNFCNFASPLLIHLLSCRMIQLTFELGFCEGSITGLAVLSHGLLLYSDDFELARKVARITASLINENANEHSLRARLAQYTINITIYTEPIQLGVDHMRMAYRSAKIAGDVDNACLSGLMYGIGSFYCTPDLLQLQNILANFLYEMADHKRIGVLHSTMSYFVACTALIGERDSCSIDARIEMKTNEMLHQIAEQSQSTYLMHHVFLNQMHVHFYYREYWSVAQLGEKYEIHCHAKRALDLYYIFTFGMSSLCLARHTGQEKWKKIGEKLVKAMAQIAERNSFSYEHKLSLMQAELHYLDGRHGMAETLYKAAIISVREHKFYHEEALAFELYGIFLVESKQILRGLMELQMAAKKYKQLGAMKKTDDVMEFMEFIQQSHSLLKPKLIGSELAATKPPIHFDRIRSQENSVVRSDIIMKTAESNRAFLAGDRLSCNDGKSALIVLAELAEEAAMDGKRKERG